MSLIIKQLNVKLQKNEILHEVNLQVKEGEFISLLGESGCGKSTLLKSIAGLLEIESGEISINGQLLNQLPPEKRGTVIVFQDLRLFPHMTIEKNIAFSLELQKIPETEKKEIVFKLLEKVQLSGYGKRKIKEMSGGQLQRVALARALAANPKVLLLDEPFSGLDERLRIEMGALVKKVHRERQITTILVTHDKREALQMSDRIALMHDGDIQQYDTPQNIFYHPVSRRVAAYFGKGNYMLGVVENGQFYSKGLCITANVPNGKYEAFVRPASIKVSAEGKGCRIHDIIFMGETAELLLDTPFGRLEGFTINNEINQVEFKIGNEVGIRIEESGVHYFPIEEN